MNDERVQTPAVPVCYRHPGRETYVRCTRCDRPICPDCMHNASVGHQCPECVAQGRRTMRPTRTAFGGSTAGRHGYVTYTLLGLNVLVTLIGLVFAAGQGLAGGLLSGGLSPIHVWGAVVAIPLQFPDGTAVNGIAGGEYWRLGTAMFIHFGVFHLFVNMWALVVLGRYLETALGPARFLALYLVAGLGGDVAAYLFAAQNGVTAGASGAIFGLFSALFFVNRKLRLDNSGVIVLILINLSLGFFIPGISIVGHLGGLVTGALIGFGMAYAPRQHRALIQVGTVVLVVAALLVAVALRTATLLG